MKTNLIRATAICLIILPACFGLDFGGSGGGPAADPRLGELGRVRFVGGGGCNSSTTLAIGATAHLTLEPQEGVVIPADLAVSSTVPDVIEARGGEMPDEVILTAQHGGDAVVELRSAGELFDYLGFSAEPAASVTYQAPEAVFAGGAIVLKIDEVYGACGEDCPLIGGGFLEWSASPEPAFTLQQDHERVATFTSGGAAGAVRLLGKEPTSGATLIDHPVSIVAADSAGELEARITIMLPDETVIEPQPLPVEMPVGSLFLIEIQASGGEGIMVPVAGVDIVWTVEADEGIIETFMPDSPPPPEGPIFVSVGSGEATLVAEVSLLGKTGRFQLEVFDPSGGE